MNQNYHNSHFIFVEQRHLNYAQLQMMNPMEFLNEINKMWPFSDISFDANHLLGNFHFVNIIPITILSISLLTLNTY